MSYSFNTVMFMTFLIIVINLQCLDSTKLLTRSQPASPCCQQLPYFTLFSYSSCACPQPSTVPSPKRVPIDFGLKELALKPVEILAGASHLALGTILNIGGMPFKFIGTVTKNGGEFAETLGYDLKTTGSLKFNNGISSIISSFQKLGQPAPVVCVVKDEKIDVYQPVVEKKKEKVEKVVKTASPCCQQPSYFTLFSYSPCACPPPPPPAREPLGLGLKELAFKPIEILAGASHLALGTILNIGGMPFKFIGTVTRNGGELAENLVYDMKTTGVNKVSNGISSIVSSFQKLGQPAPVICVVKDDKIDVYQPVEKKEKVEKVEKIEKVAKIEKDSKIVKVKVNPTPYTTTTVKYVPTTLKPVTKYSQPPVTTPYPIIKTTVKPLVTTPYLTAAPTMGISPSLPIVAAYDTHDLSGNNDDNGNSMNEEED